MGISSEPKWIEKIYSENTGEDFIGLRSVATNITTYLLPGIITITPRARYYSFYSWLLHEYEDHHPPKSTLASFIKRREQIFALANFIFDTSYGYGDGTTGMIGKIKIRQHVWDIGDSKDIPLIVDDYVAAHYGGFGQYSGVMRSLEIIRDSEEVGTDLDLLPKSIKLADGFQDAIKDTRYYQKRNEFDLADTIPLKVLMEYGEKCYLSGLADAPDASPILETLFGMDEKYILPEPQTDIPTFGNMGGSLALMLEMLDQSEKAFDDQVFRDSIMYGLCTDFRYFQPSKNLEAFIANWRMFQLREYYVFAIYEFWIYFLDVLRTNGPFNFDVFRSYLDNQINLSDGANIIGIELPVSKPSEITIADFLHALVQQSEIVCNELSEGCEIYVNQYNVKANEKYIQSLLDSGDYQNREGRFMHAWFILASTYLRLKGVKSGDNKNAWYWAREGGARRRSMALFVHQMDIYIDQNKSLLQVLEWLFRDYVLAQHTITALEKWRQRNVNTFHFSYENGVYEWIKMDTNTYTASRFFQANSMIRDLGLVSLDEIGGPTQTTRGKDTLNRVVRKLGG